MAAKNKTILIVDDEVNLLEVFSEKLKSAGYDVAEAASGEAAIEKLKTIRPDLILLDLKMAPGMDGMETISKIKENPQWRKIRVAFLTNYGEPRPQEAWIDEKVSREVGAVAYIRKTDDLDKIAEEINSILEH